MSADRPLSRRAAVDPIQVYAEARRLRAEALHAAFSKLLDRARRVLVRDAAAARGLSSPTGRA